MIRNKEDNLVHSRFDANPLSGSLEFRSVQNGVVVELAAGDETPDGGRAEEPGANRGTGDVLKRRKAEPAEHTPEERRHTPACSDVPGGKGTPYCFKCERCRVAVVEHSHVGQAQYDEYQVASD